jgi:hypothetical protein
VFTASLLLELSRLLMPGLAHRLERASVLLDTGAGRSALQECYAFAKEEDFFRVFLEPCPWRFVVSRLPTLTWGDWDTQEQVIASLRSARLLPSWFGKSALYRNGVVHDVSHVPN